MRRSRPSHRAGWDPVLCGTRTATGTLWGAGSPGDLVAHSYTRSREIETSR
jgi:hypothetical protein